MVVNPGNTGITSYTSEELTALQLQFSFLGVHRVFNGTYVIYISLTRPGNLI